MFHRVLSPNERNNVDLKLIKLILIFNVQVVEIVDSSSGEESSSSSSDSDDCIMLSDSEVPPSPEAEDDPGNSGRQNI